MSSATHVAMSRGGGGTRGCPPYGARGGEGPGERLQIHRRQLPAKCCVSDWRTQSITLRVSHEVSLA